MLGVVYQIRVATAERIWRAHPRWSRDSTTAQKRVERMVGEAMDGLVSLPHPLLGGSHFTDLFTETEPDIVEGLSLLLTRCYYRLEGMMDYALHSRPRHQAPTLPRIVQPRENDRPKIIRAAA